MGSPTVHQHRAPSSWAPQKWPQAQALRQAVADFCAAGLVPAVLCGDAQVLCDEAEAGITPPDHAIEEIRALLGGIALRSQGIGQRCCGIADILLTDLSKMAGVTWAGCTVPGGEDRANGRTGLIELRFPASDIWTIPAVAHEMGHVLARAAQLGRRLGAANGARRVIAEGSPAAQREELFCDFYATYVMGPAFPAFMILERLNPSLAAPEQPFPEKEKITVTHPAPDKRVLVMMRTLRALDEAAGPLRAPYAEAREFLEATWQERLRDVGKAIAPHPNTQTVVQHLVDRLWFELDPVLDCRFATPMAARALAEELRTGSLSVPTSDVRLLDVVAAGWQARITRPIRDCADIADLAERTLTIAENVAQRAGIGGENSNDH